MSTALITRRQIGAIHAIAKKLGLDEDTRRSVIELHTGKRSCAELSNIEAGRVIEGLKAKLPQSNDLTAMSKTLAANGGLHFDGPYAGKLRALWLSGWNLGVVTNRTDTALAAFITRVTGISHPRFLRDPDDARKAIEGLKAWLVREAGVTWSGRGQAEAAKLAVINAQRVRLVALGADPSSSVYGLDEVATMLGSRLRRALKQKQPPPQPTQGAASP